MVKRALFAATAAKGHINVFHKPYIKMLRNKGWIVDVVTNGDEKITEADNEHAVSIKRSPFDMNNIKALFDVALNYD